jgi:hypothetical protein
MHRSVIGAAELVKLEAERLPELGAAELVELGAMELHSSS